MAIQWQVVAVFSAQDLGGQRRRRHAPWRSACRVLEPDGWSHTPGSRAWGDESSPPALIPGPSRAHFAGRDTDEMEHAAANGACRLVMVDRDVSVRKIGPKRRPRRRPTNDRLFYSGALRLGAADVRVQFVDSQSELIRVQSLGAPAELAAAQLPDDQLVLGDVVVMAGLLRRQIADELLQ